MFGLFLYKKTIFVYLCMNDFVKVWYSMYKCLNSFELTARQQELSLSNNAYQLEFQVEVLNILSNNN